MLERSLMGFSLSHFFAVLLGNAYPEMIYPDRQLPEWDGGQKSHGPQCR